MTKLTTEPRQQERLRIEAGWQCPECHGVNITRRFDRFYPQPVGFSCRECGCQWSPKKAAAKPVATILMTTEPDEPREVLELYGPWFPKAGGAS